MKSEAIPVALVCLTIAIFFHGCITAQAMNHLTDAIRMAGIRCE